jgi:histidinol-phosphate aminotransferase
MSKWAGLAGLRVGFVVAEADIIEGLCALRDSFNSYTVDRLAQAGAAAALRSPAYYADTTAKVIATRERVAAELVKKGFTVLPSRANFIFVRHPSLGGGDFMQDLRNKGILVRHFSGGRVEDFVRISIGTDADMDILLEKL